MIRPDGTVSDAILTTLSPADRIPSVGHQLTIEPHPTDVCWDCYQPDPEPVAPQPVRKPERLALWDQTASLEL